MRTQDGAAIERFVDAGIGRAPDALTDGPLGPGVVLRLNGAEPGDDLRRILNLRLNEPLVSQAAANQIHSVESTRIGVCQLSLISCQFKGCRGKLELASSPWQRPNRRATEAQRHKENIRNTPCLRDSVACASL